MITKWGVKNFKSILEADLDLAPLTVFTGVNSSGKSSFLQSIVMLAQAARSRASKNSGIVKLKGHLIDLGSFSRICHNKASEPVVGVKFTSMPLGRNTNYSLGENENVYLELGLSDGSECLNVAEGHLVYKRKEEEEDKNYSITWKGDKDFPFNDEKLWREIMSHGRICIPFDRIDVNSGNVVYGLFLPGAIHYKPCDVDSRYWNELIHKFTELLADIPAEKLTKEDAEKYAGKKLEEMFINKGEYDFTKQLFYLCANNLWWIQKDGFGINKEELGKKTVLFKKIPYFEEVFSDFKDVDDFGSERYKIELSDWYQVLSNDDKYKQEAIKKELENETEFVKSLGDNITRFQNEKSVIILSLWLTIATQHIRDYFIYNVKYLGPVREDPKWNYTLDSSNYKTSFSNVETWIHAHSHAFISGFPDSPLDPIMIDVGVKGERTPLVINYLSNRFKIINYYSPSCFETQDYKPESEKLFNDALIEWLQYIDISEKFITKELEKEKRFEIDMVINEQEFAIPQLGTGVSQVLPILVMCLSAPIDSTLIIEQPELHLHPKMQSRLADFFIAMSLSGRQCLIETHSEYLIYMIRYRISQSLLRNDESVQKAVKLLYAEKENGETKFQEIKINRHGELSAWPDGFFDERQKLSDMMLEGIISEIDT